MYPAGMITAAYVGSILLNTGKTLNPSSHIPAGAGIPYRLKSPRDRPDHPPARPIAAPGLWVTLAAPGGTAFENVTPTAIPEFTSLPAGYVFPIGFLSLGLTNLPVNGVVTITNFLHLAADSGFSYGATTYFNFGPTPNNSTPHWYQFLFDGTNGAEMFSDRVILHFHDGARGDHDLSANHQIVTIGAPAYQLPPAPQLAIALSSAGSSNIISSLVGTNGIFSPVTNVEPVVTIVLSCPADATNYELQYVNDLSFQNPLSGLLAPFWQTVTQTPIVANGRNFVTNTTFGATGFYRLSPIAAVTATASAPLFLSVQLTTTNTVILSWPTAAAGFGLQQNSNLGTTNWVNVTDSVSQVGGQYQVITSPNAVGSFIN